MIPKKRKPNMEQEKISIEQEVDNFINEIVNDNYVYALISIRYDSFTKYQPLFCRSSKFINEYNSIDEINQNLSIRIVTIITFNNSHNHILSKEIITEKLIQRLKNSPKYDLRYYISLNLINRGDYFVINRSDTIATEYHLTKTLFEIRDSINSS